MTCSKNTLRMTLLSSTVLALAAHAPVIAQETNGEDEVRQLETIVVTSARGREENTVEVPISTTVFDAQTIEDAQIQQVDDFIGLTPGVTIANSQDSGTNFITIRGVSQVRNGEPPVAVVVDGVLQVDGRAFDQGLFDLESVEILRGPQGALYGRNATQGAIIINTKAPTNELEGYAQVTGGNGGTFQVESSVSGALVEDKLQGRISARYKNVDGFRENVNLGTEADFFEEFAIRGHLRATPTDNLQVDLRGSLNITDGSALNFAFQGVSLDPETGEVASFVPAEEQGADVVAQDFFGATNLGFDERDIAQLSLRVKWDLGWSTFTSVTAYDSIDQITGGDQFPYSANTTFNPGLSFFDGTQTQNIDIDAISQELRLTSRDDQAFRWSFGGYYLGTERFISSTTGFDLEQGIIAITRSPVLGGGVNPTGTFVANTDDNDAWALFFNLEYDVLDNLEIAVAGRYDRDERTQTVSDEQGAFDQDGNFDFAIGQAGAVNEANFDRFQPKVTARYLATDDISLFASWGRGFRSGQFNQNGTGAAAATVGLEGVGDLLEQENTETFEGSFKASLLGGRVQASGGAYFTEVENAPYFLFVGALGAQILVPIEEIEIIGGELEIAANLFEGLDWYGSVGISDSEIQEYSLEPQFEGNDAPYVPDVTFNTGLQYRTALPVPGNLGFFGRVDYEHRGSQSFAPNADDGLANTVRGALNLVGLRAGIEDLDGRWQLTGTVDILTDQVFNSEFVLGGFAHIAPPRTWRIDFRYNF